MVYEVVYVEGAGLPHPSTLQHVEGREAYRFRRSGDRIGFLAPFASIMYLLP